MVKLILFDSKNKNKIHTKWVRIIFTYQTFLVREICHFTIQIILLLFIMFLIPLKDDIFINPKIIVSFTIKNCLKIIYHLHFQRIF